MAGNETSGIVHVDDLLDLTFETWRRVMSVNADGTFLMGQATARAMVRQPPSALLGRPVAVRASFKTALTRHRRAAHPPRAARTREAPAGGPGRTSSYREGKL